MNRHNGCGCGGRRHSGCNPCASNNAIQQAVNDALACEKENLEQYETNAAQSATDAAKDAAKAAESASAAAQSQTNAETAAGTAVAASKSVTDTAEVLEETANSIKKALELVEEQVSAIQTKAVYFEVSTPTTAIALSDSDSVFNVRSIYVSSARQALNYGFTYDKATGTVTLAEGITAEQIAETEEGYILVEVICDMYNSDDPTSFPITLESSAGAGLIGTTQGDTVQASLDSLAATIVNAISKTQLAASDGASLVGQYATIEDLRGATLTNLGDQVYLREHTANQGAGGGTWFLYKLAAESTDVDDNGCQVITTSGQVLRRKGFQHLYSDMFGLVPGGDFDTCANNMFLASRTFHIEDAWVCHMGRDAAKPRSAGNLVFDISDGLSFYLRGVGGARFGATILHSGDNVCMRIRKNYNDSKEFWVSGGFEGLRVIGVGASYTGTNTNTNAIALQLSDMWGGSLKDLYISGYTGNTSGAAISLYNDTAWTEGTRLEDVVIRSTVNGLWFHRNTATGSTATDSFFKTVGDLDINAGVSGTAINFIKIGDGTSAGACLLYGHDIKLTGWMSNGSWHNGILVTNYSTCVNGRFHLNFDGYGISSSATAEVVHLIRLGGTSALFDCEVLNTSGQSNGYSISMLKLIANSCLYLDDAAVFTGTISRGRPLVRPKGLVMRFNGTFTQAECIAGATYSLSGLLPGTKWRVRLTSWNNNSQYEMVTQEWDVEVRGTDFPCIVKPFISSGTSLSTTNVSGGAATTIATTTDTFMKSSTETATAVTGVTPTRVTALASATLTTSQLLLNGAYGTSLTLNNGQTSNSISYLANSGRKINIVLPADSDATQAMPYSVEIEVM